MAVQPAPNASKTALGVAIQRAIHQQLDGEPKILDDAISGRLVGAAALQRRPELLTRARLPEVAGLRAHVVLRSRFAEDRLAEAVTRGVGQLVILGAGFDTFAYRQPDWARRLRIFEVDQPATQMEKRERLQHAGVAIPANLEFVAIDFEKVSLREGLRTSTLDFSRPVFFTCLGVLMYLNDAAVRDIFQLVASFPAGSEIAFTFSTAASVQSELAQRAAALGEPWHSHLDPATLAEDLRAAGYSQVTLLGVAEARDLYFAGRSDGLPAPRRASIAAARV